MPHDKIISVIDRETGNVISTITRTAEQSVGWEKHIAAEREREARQYYYQKQETELGNFIWLLYNTHKALDLGLRPAELTRVIYLATFMNRDNYIVLPNGSHVKGAGLSKVLNIGCTAANQFFNSAVGCEILSEDSEGYLKLSSQVFAKGRLSEIVGDKNAMRLYINGIRHLYEKSKPREHRFLYYVFQTIPYVNVNLNILCRNPYALTIQKAVSLDITEYCELIGYDITHTARLRDILLNIEVFGEGVFGFMKTKEGNYIVINPRVFYAGNQYEQVMGLGEFFRKDGDENLQRQEVRTKNNE